MYSTFDILYLWRKCLRVFLISDSVGVYEVHLINVHFNSRSYPQVNSSSNHNNNSRVKCSQATWTLLSLSWLTTWLSTKVLLPKSKSCSCKPKQCSLEWLGKRCECSEEHPLNFWDDYLSAWDERFLDFTVLAWKVIITFNSLIGVCR